MVSLFLHFDIVISSHLRHLFRWMVGATNIYFTSKSGAFPYIFGDQCHRLFFCAQVSTSFATLIAFPALFYVGLFGFGPFVTVIWLWVCATLIGAKVADILKIGKEKWFSLRSSAIGFAIIGTAVGLLAHFLLIHQIYIFFILSNITNLHLFSLGKTKRFSLKMILLDKGNRTLSENIMATFAFLGINLVIAVTMLPDLGYDALAYHLTIPSHMLEIGFWRFDVKQYAWSVMPFGADWLFVPAYFSGGEQGARLLNSSFLIATAVVSYQLLKPKVGTVLALAGPAILLTLPLSLLEVGTAFVEAPLAFFFLMAIAELISFNEKERGNAVAVAIFAGFACAIKLLGVLILPFLFVGLIIRARFALFENQNL